MIKLVLWIEQRLLVMRNSTMIVLSLWRGGGIMFKLVLWIEQRLLVMRNSTIIFLNLWGGGYYDQISPLDRAKALSHEE